MSVLATFDLQAQWAQTHVCDSLVLQNLQALGAAWGRWNVQRPWPVGGSLAALRESRRAELAELHARFGTATVDRARLLSESSEWPQQRRDWRRLRAHGAWSVHWVLEGTLLVHLQTDGGYVGVLCEAGEWLAIPAGVPYARDAGDAPDVDVLVLSAPAAGLGPQAEARADPGLPSLDDFVETMLELTGHAADD